MTPVRSRLVLFSLLGSFAAACRGPLPVAFFEERPPGSGTWTEVEAEPAWVKAPPRKADHVAFVVQSQSNLRDIAKANLPVSAERDIATRVQMALRTVVTSPEAAAAAAVVPASLRLVQCACRDEVLTRDLVPGNTLATVWGLYEIPIKDLVAPLHESHRALGTAALEKL